MNAETPSNKIVEMRGKAAPTPEPVQAAPSATGASDPKPAPKGGGRRRLLLMFGVPVVILVGGLFFYLTGGRYVSTDNAYVLQDKVTVYPELSGMISKVSVRQNQLVKQGDVLFEINAQPAQIALEQANAAVAAARLQVGQLRAAYVSAVAARKTADENLAFHRSSLQRQQDLLKRGFASQAAYDQEQNNLHTAEQQFAQATQQVESTRSALGGNPDIATDDHPTVMQSVANQEKAALDLARTVIRAPANGVIAQTDRLQLGQYVTSSTAVLSLVQTDQAWVEANFKETDLTHLSVGQKATISLDAYPGRTIEATVDSIGAGTGSQFSIIPAQNATGNWVKVVQRLPVRLRLTGTPVLPFRTGLSASVEVDTGHRRSLPFFSANAEELPPAGQFAGAK